MTIKNDEAIKTLDQIAKRAKFIHSKAINETLYSVRGELVKQMDKNLDGGAMAFTKNRLLRGKHSYSTGKGGSLFFHKDAFFMEEVVYGGNKQPRRKKLGEPIQENIKLDRYGNIRRNYQQKALRYVQKNVKQMLTHGPTAKLGQKYMKTREWVMPEGLNRKRNTPGIYRFYNQKNRAPKLIVSYARNARKQRPIFPMHKRAQIYFKMRLPAGLRKAYEYERRTRK